MAEEALETEFLTLVNENLGIARRISRAYFPAEAERNDAVQEMMYQLWRSYPTFDKRSKFSTWMYSVCLNTALTYWKKNKRQQRETLHPLHDEIAETTTGDPEENIKSMYHAISQLSALNKAIVLLYLENLSYEEIASITGLTKSNISVRLVRIKKELEIQLKDKI